MFVRRASSQAIGGLAIASQDGSGRGFLPGDVGGGGNRPTLQQFIALDIGEKKTPFF